MSRPNVEIARSVIEAYNRRDLEGALAFAGPGFELDLSRAAGPVHGVYGRDRIQGFWDEFGEGWESARIEPHEFIEAGDDVVVPWTLHLKGRGGIEVQARVTWTFTLRDGFVERMCMYQERRDALEAAGLSD